MSEAQNNNNKSTDVMVKFKSCKTGQNKNNNLFMDLNLSPEEVVVLIETLEKVTNDRGAKITVHTSERESKNGNKFLGAVAFVKGIPEPQARTSGAVQNKAPEQRAAIDGAGRLAALRQGRK